MNFKRPLSAILAGLLLAASLSACATNDDTPDETKPTVQTTAPVEEGETELRDNLQVSRPSVPPEPVYGDLYRQSR